MSEEKIKAIANPLAKEMLECIIRQKTKRKFWSASILAVLEKLERTKNEVDISTNKNSVLLKIKSKTGKIFIGRYEKNAV